MNVGLSESANFISNPILATNDSTIDFIVVKFASDDICAAASFLTVTICVSCSGSRYATSPISNIFCGNSSCLLSSKNSSRLFINDFLIIVLSCVIGCATVTLSSSTSFLSFV